MRVQERGVHNMSQIRPSAPQKRPICPAHRTAMLELNWLLAPWRYAMSRTIVFISAAMLVVGGPGCLTAQQPSAASVRTEVQQAVRTYVDAWNKADASNLVEMYSRDEVGC